MDLLRLSAGELRLALAPSVGGSIASFTRVWRDRGRLRELHWLRPASPDALAARDPLGMASFPLLPYCNRIRNGRASFAGREIRFPPNHPGAEEPHPLHGIGWQQAWQLVSAQECKAELALDVPASARWPWHFSARQHFRLTVSRLEVTISITNHDSADMPAGIGHHPYFPNEVGTHLTTRTRAMWHADSEVMPISLGPHGAVERLAAGVQVADLDLDNNFAGWERRALIEWPADRRGPQRSLVMLAQPPMNFFVLYCPAGFDYFCAEPVSQCTDWLNLLPAFGAEAVGGSTIKPGDRLDASFTLEPEWL